MKFSPSIFLTFCALPLLAGCVAVSPTEQSARDRVQAVGTQLRPDDRPPALPGLQSASHEGRRFAVCCPMRLQMFERARDRFARGDRPQTLLQQLIDEIKWRDSGN